MNPKLKPWSFETYKQALSQAKYQTFLTGKKHKAIKTRQLAVEPEDEIICYTVVLV